MHLDYWRNHIVRAVVNDDKEAIDTLARRLGSANAAHSFLVRKGYGKPGQELDDIARQVPEKE